MTKALFACGKHGFRVTVPVDIISFTVYTVKYMKEVLMMAVKAVNFKMDEVDLADIRHVADVYRMTLTDFIKEAIGEYLIRMKADPFYRLTENVEEADAAEADEILNAINALKDDDLAIASTERFTV